MSALYFELYVGKNDENGLGVIREFFSICKTKDWDTLIQRFGDSCKQIVGFSADSNVSNEKVYKGFEHYLDMAPIERESTNAIMFEFDTFTSFKDDEFIKFLLGAGVERIEASIEHSGVGVTYFKQNEEYFETYDENNWAWLPRLERINRAN